MRSQPNRRSPTTPPTNHQHIPGVPILSILDINVHGFLPDKRSTI